MRNLKRALSLALASVMLLGMMVVGTSAASYADVDSKDNLEAIEVLKLVGVMTGDDKGNFNPDANVTRNEMAVIMCNLLGLKTGGNHPFTDVPAWAAPYVAACYNNGIIAGVSATQFNGDANVTAVQASLMVMKALGYFGYAGEFGDNWKLSVVKQANKIDLYDGINAYTDQIMTRNEVAQLVLNALECTVMVVTEHGGLSVEGNGIAVNQKPSYTYDEAANNSGLDYGAGVVGEMELCEKLYGNDLRKNGDATDDFGRPASEWTYHTTSIKCADEATLTYTKDVKVKDIYADLGKPSNAFVQDTAARPAAGKIVIDGQQGQQDNGPADITSMAGNNNKVGGKGTLTEVYFDKNSGEVNIICTKTYLAKATEDFDTKDEEVDVNIYDSTTTAATLSSDDFAVTGVKEDDYLLVNLAYDGSNYVVKAVSAPTIVKNVVVSVARATDYVTAGGTKYEYSAVAKASGSGALGQSLMAGSSSYDINGDGYNLYLDAYGYVVGVEGYDAGVNLDDYLFVKQVSTNGFDNIAKALFADGTTKTITVDKVGGSDTYTWSDSAIANRFYTFDTDKDGNYELTVVPTTGTKKVTQDSKTSAITSAAKPVSGAPAGTSATVFIAKDKVYTGVKNAPEVASGTVYYLVNDDGRLMLVYSATPGSSKTNSDDIVFVLNSNPAKSKDGDDPYYIYNVIKNGEKTTLDANQNSKAAGIYVLNTYTDGRADLGTRLVDGEDQLVNILNPITSAAYKDGTLTLGSAGYILADDAKIFTIDGNTVKSIAASGVKKAVEDGFTYTATIEKSKSDDSIVTVYMSKNDYVSVIAASAADISTELSSKGSATVTGDVPTGTYGDRSNTLESGALTLSNAAVKDAVTVVGAVGIAGTTTVNATLTANQIDVDGGATLKLSAIDKIVAQAMVIEAGAKIDLGVAGVYAFNTTANVQFGSDTTNSYVNGISFAEKGVSNTGIMGMLQTANALGYLK